MGSRLAMSPPFNHVMVPPGWISLLAAVLGGAVTEEMPPTGPLPTFDLRAVVLLLVPPFGRSVVGVAFPPAAAVVVDSPGAVVCSVGTVVLDSRLVVAVVAVDSC